MTSWLRAGLSAGFAHRRLVLAAYLAGLLPALVWALAGLRVLGDAFGDRPLADHLLSAGGFEAWMEYAVSGEFRFSVLIGAVPLVLVLAWLVQLLVTAGSMNVLWRPQGPEGSFLGGVARYGGRFVRSALVFAFELAVLAGLLSAASGRLAEAAGDGRVRLGLRLAGFAVVLLVFVVLDLAYDLSRLAAVAHHGRQTARGFLRAQASVLRRPGRLIALYLVLAASAAVLTGIFVLLRGGFRAGTAVGIAAAFLLQQALMVGRSYLQVSWLGAEVAAYRDLGDPDWCRGRPPAPPAAIPPPAGAEGEEEPSWPLAGAPAEHDAPGSEVLAPPTAGAPPPLAPEPVLPASSAPAAEPGSDEADGEDGERAGG